MATIRHALTLKHQANLGEDVEDVTFEVGEQVTILREWNDRYFCKNAAGLVFNIPKEHVDAG